MSDSALAGVLGPADLHAASPPKTRERVDLAAIDAEAFRRGDPECFRVVLKRFGPIIRSVVRSYAKNADDQEDLYQEVSVRNQSPGAPDYLSDAVQLMKHNVSERLFVEEIAEYLKVSTRQLERAFKRYFNTSPSQYYLRVRLNAARNLLRHSSMTVRAIAIETGFKSLQHFSKCYFDHFKVRPTQERGR